MTIVPPGFGLICETDAGKVLLEESLSPHNTNMWDIIICIWAVKGSNVEKLNSIHKMYIKWQLYNLKLASYVSPRVGKYCWKNTWVHTSQLCQIYLFAYYQWVVEMSKNDIELTKWLSNGNCTTWNWHHKNSKNSISKRFYSTLYITILHHIYLTFKSYGSGRLPLRQLVAADMGATLINYFYIYILLIFITQVLLLP